MNLNNFTIQATEVVQSAQQAAFNGKNPNIESEHVLQSLVDVFDGVVVFRND